MKTSIFGIELIKKHEGFVPSVYKDAVGLETIGYGHLLTIKDKREGIYYGRTISKEEGTELLRRDLRIAEQSISRNIHVPLRQFEFDALVSFVFNLGGGALQRSTLRSKLNREDRLGASNEFLKWVYAGGRKLRGLIRRREEERSLFLDQLSMDIGEF
tara:strand:- start:24 stop:497 length:474 start_codon:yes stop_codon:yes gene_type:complete